MLVSPVILNTPTFGCTVKVQTPVKGELKTRYPIFADGVINCMQRLKDDGFSHDVHIKMNKSHYPDFVNVWVQSSEKDSVTVERVLHQSEDPDILGLKLVTMARDTVKPTVH